jgi:hypothetical protein
MATVRAKPIGAQQPAGVYGRHPPPDAILSWSAYGPMMRGTSGESIFPQYRVAG